MTLRSNTRAVNRVWTTNARVELAGLVAAGGRPAGDPDRPEPSSLLGLLIEPSGATSLDVAFSWNRDDPNVTFQQAVGQGLQAAVRDRMIANVPNMLGGLLGALVQGASDAGDAGDGAPASGASSLQGLLESLGAGAR